MPVWALFVAIVIGAGFTLPIGIIYAITNNELGLNVITEFIIGYMVPGKPVRSVKRQGKNGRLL